MLGLLSRVYAALLFAYPRAFREQYGTEMRRVFGEKVRDVLSTRGYFGLVRYCGHVAGDLVASVIRERTAANSPSPVAMRFAMLGCLTVILAILWFDRRHIPGLGWLALYGVVSLLVTAKHSWARYSLARSARYGLLAAAVFVAVTLVFFFTLPWFASSRRAESMILLAPIGSLGFWAAAGFQEARESGSALAGIMTAIWSSMVSVSFHLAASLVFWEVIVLKFFPSLLLFLPIPWNLSATNPTGITLGTMAWLRWGIMMGSVMGIIGGTAGAWRRRTSLRPTW